MQRVEKFCLSEDVLQWLVPSTADLFPSGGERAVEQCLLLTENKYSPDKEEKNQKGMKHPLGRGGGGVVFPPPGNCSR